MKTCKVNSNVGKYLAIANASACPLDSAGALRHRVAGVAQTLRVLAQASAGLTAVPRIAMGKAPHNCDRNHYQMNWENYIEFGTAIICWELFIKIWRENG